MDAQSLCQSQKIFTSPQKSDSVSTEGSFSNQSSPRSEEKRLFEKQTILISEQEVSQHNSKEDLWIIINNKVLDVTKFQKSHPGGALTLEAVAGKDASQIFNVYHPEEVYSYLDSYKVGDLICDSSTSQDPLVKDFMSLNEVFKKEGLYKVSVYYYLKRGFVSLGLFVLAWFFMFQGGKESSFFGAESKFDFYLGSIFLGIFFQQTAFIGHDCGHTAIFHNRKKDCLLGFLVGNTLTGISIGWWKDSHNTHHVVPNEISFDPDIQHLPFFAVARDYFLDIYSRYHQRVMKLDFFARKIIQIQHFLYYPVMAVARFFLYLQSMLFILNLKPRKCEFFWQEALGQTIFFTWLKNFFSLCPDTTTSIACLFLAHAISGMLHVQITLSHFAMETFSQGKQYTTELNFIDLQIKSTLDVINHPLMDWFHGGLQFQLSHHLFPRMPRHNLPIVRKRVKTLLEKHGKKYNLMTFYQANVLTYYKLKEQADLLRKNPDAKFTETMLWDGINARG